MQWHDPVQQRVRQTQVDYRQAGGRLLASSDGIAIAVNQPVPLQRVAIAKPWGQELWYTGIEQRGQSRAGPSPEESLPLALYLALAPNTLGRDAAPVLLKILDPKPQDPTGNLYFELHQEKQEVYVVTHVDRGAWPDGVGAIRLGIDPEVRARYSDDDKLRADYLAAVLAYEAVRRNIDKANQKPDTALQQQERQRRTAMEAFVALHPLQVGDVVTVDPWYPHALQHGVRVVELQTPTYERLIISFAQAVLTQDHWDSAQAIANMSLDAPPAQPRTTTDVMQNAASGASIIAEYSDFKAWSVTLLPGHRLTIPKQPSYALAIGVSGNTDIGNETIAAEAACLIPALALPCDIANTSSRTSQLILGGPPTLQLEPIAEIGH